MRDYCAGCITSVLPDQCLKVLQFLFKSSILINPKKPADKKNLEDLQSDLRLVTGNDVCTTLKNHMRDGRLSSNVNHQLIVSIYETMRHHASKPQPFPIVYLLDCYGTLQSTLMGPGNRLIWLWVDPFMFYQNVIHYVIEKFKQHEIYQLSDSNYAMSKSLMDDAISLTLATLITFPVDETRQTTEHWQQQFQQQVMYDHYIEMKEPRLRLCDNLSSMVANGNKTDKTDDISSVQLTALKDSLMNMIQTQTQMHLQTLVQHAQYQKAIIEKFEKTLTQHVKTLQELMTAHEKRQESLLALMSSSLKLSTSYFQQQQQQQQQQQHHHQHHQQLQQQLSLSSQPSPHLPPTHPSHSSPPPPALSVAPQRIPMTQPSSVAASLLTPKPSNTNSPSLPSSASSSLTTSTTAMTQKSPAIATPSSATTTSSSAASSSSPAGGGNLFSTMF